jgi:hypothetical protein
MTEPCGALPRKCYYYYLLGLALAGFSTSPDNGPWAMAEVVHVGTPCEKQVTDHAIWLMVKSVKGL